VGRAHRDVTRPDATHSERTTDPKGRSPRPPTRWDLIEMTDDREARGYPLAGCTPGPRLRRFCTAVASPASPHAAAANQRSSARRGWSR
jgi:hypothetical protein